MSFRFFGKIDIQAIFLVAYIAIAFGLPLNKIVLSLATILLVFLTIINFDKIKYKTNILQNRVIQILILFILIHFISFFWAEDTTYFWKDFNTKLPFYALPIVFILNPIKEKKELNLVFISFIFSLLITSIINFYTYYFHSQQHDIRYMSIFLSHIRYGIMLVFGMAICTFWIINENKKFKWITLILFIWFGIYTYFSEVFSAYLSFFVLITFLIFLKIQTLKNIFLRKLVLIFIACSTIIGIISVIYILLLAQPKIPFPQKNEKSKLGNEYYYEKDKTTRINGTPVYTYICGIELKSEWKKKSKQDIFQVNPSGFENYYILIQYLASKGFLKKDAESFSKLSIQDIKNIENGVNNCCPSKKSGLINRLQILKEEFYEPDPNGKTVKQRLEYLKAGWNLFSNNYIFGISSGDLENEFQKYYIKKHSKLKPENRLRTHNQILTYFISFGIIGGIVFLALFWVSTQQFMKQKNYLAVIFSILVLLSFLNEDTLETQMGATFVGFFLGLFISLPNKNLHEN